MTFVASCREESAWVERSVAEDSVWTENIWRGRAEVTSSTLSNQWFYRPLLALHGLHSYKSFISPWRIYSRRSIEMVSIALIIDEASILNISIQWAMYVQITQRTLTFVTIRVIRRKRTLEWNTVAAFECICFSLEKNPFRNLYWLSLDCSLKITNSFYSDCILNTTSPFVAFFCFFIKTSKNITISIWIWKIALWYNVKSLLFC